MSNKTVFVPVDPEGFGCGLLLGLIIRYWREILITGLVIFGCIFLGNIVLSITSFISTSNEASARATQSIIQSVTEENRQVLLNTALSNIRQYRGVITIGKSIQETERGLEDSFVQVNTVEFSDNGINIFFDAITLNDAPPEQSCIERYGGDPSHVFTEILVGTNTGWSYVNAISYQGTKDDIVRNDGYFDRTVHQYKGYVTYPYIIFPDSAEILGSNSVYYFRFICSNYHTRIPLFDIADFGH